MLTSFRYVNWVVKQTGRVNIPTLIIIFRPIWFQGWRECDKRNHTARVHWMKVDYIGLREENKFKSRNLKIEVFDISREQRTSRSHVTMVLPSGLRFEVFTLERLDHDPELIDLPQSFLLPKTSQSHVWEEININEFCMKKRNFEDNFSAKIGGSGWVKANMAAAMPANLKTGNGKPLTSNRSLAFAVKWSNLDLGF